MEIEILQTLISNPEDLIKGIIEEAGAPKEVADYLAQYDPYEHAVTSTTLRPNKDVSVTVIEDGVTKIITSSVPVSRLALPVQKKIVGLAASFLCGNPIELEAQTDDQNEQTLIDAIQQIWEDNKLDYESKKIAKIMMSETEVAELWFTEPVEPDYWKGKALEGSRFKLRMRILANSLGDKLYPVFSKSGDMIAFGRGYTTYVEGKKVEAFDLYTAEITYSYLKESNWTALPPINNPIKKIPVIYYSQAKPEWHDVQSLVDRLETLISNHADSNDYFGSPMVKVKGTVNGFSTKGQQGKVIEMDEGSDAEYLTWDQAPGSIELEYKNLRSLIFDMTDTPDISIEQMKSLGTYSGIALKMLFMSAHLKAADKEENFGKNVQRRINYHKAAASVLKVSLESAVNVVIKPKFEYFLPKNDQEKIEMLSMATGSKPILSRKSAVRLNPLVNDADAEQTELEIEDEAIGQYLNQ